MRRLELIEIYEGELYYRILEGQNISYALGFEQARKYVDGEAELTNSSIIEEHGKLAMLIIMTRLRNLLIKFVEAKSQR